MGKHGQKHIRIPIAPPTKKHKDKKKYTRKKKHKDCGKCTNCCRPDGGRDGSGIMF